MKIITAVFGLILLFSDISYSQFHFFGRNKVQYEKFDWKVLRTPNFDIYYYNETEAIAEIGAAYAEEAYAELKVKFNHLVTRKIPLIFYNTSLHFQQTNTTPGHIPEGVGGFFEFIKGRVVIPFTGSLHDFRHVIRHELVHVFMVTKVYRILSDHRMSTDVLPPLWFVEGLAEFYSTEVDAQAEMVMRDAVINNYFVGIADIYRIYGSFLMYKEGQSFLEFVKEKYGEEKVMQFLDNFWMYSNNFEKIIEYTLDKKLEDIDSEWSYYLKQKYYPLLQENRPPEVAADKITKQGFNFSPVLYRSGEDEYIYFNANRNGYSSLYRMKRKINNENETPELLIRGERTQEFEAFHLFQSSIDISADGLLAFVTKSGATDAIHFYSIGREEVIKSFQQPFLISISSPKFSASGEIVVFNAVDQKGFSDIYTLNIIDNTLTRLTNDYFDDRDPCFGRNDNEIIFSSDRTSGIYGQKYNLFSFNLENNRISYVTYINANSYSPVLNSAGDKILFTSDYNGVRNVWMAEITENKVSDTVYQVTDLLTSSFNPVFISDDEILFTAFEKFSFNIYSYNIAENENNMAVIRMEFDSTGSSWHPERLFVATEKERYQYEKEYTLDYAQSQVTTDPVFGTRGGAIFSLSDLFGDDNYFFLLYNSAEVQSDFLKSFNVVIQRLNLSERANYGYGIFHFSGRRYDIRESEEYFFERSYGGFFQMHFPLSKFQRIEAGISLANSDKQIITGFLERKALLVSNTLSYVHDNSLWGPSGPLDGIRALMLLGFTSDVRYSNVNYFTMIADYRHYFRMSLRSSVALRGALFYNEGKEARRYFMGGSWDLRGWPRWSIRGEKMWLSSMEYRFPLVDALHLRLPFMNLGFSNIRGAAFFDAGSAWDNEYHTTLGSMGAGVRFNLFNVLVLRYDIGKKIEKNFSTFQDGLFYQFFFGWDF
jgi:Tol biopolymer transport system component